ncbi:MAG: hypothetical protein ACK4YP_01640 [Myxococcota bacterium]
MHRLLLPFLLLAGCAPEPDLARYTYGGGDGLAVSFLPAEAAAGVEGTVRAEGAPAGELREGCTPGRSSLSAKGGVDGGGALFCAAPGDVPLVDLTGALAGPAELTTAWVSVQDGRLADAALELEGIPGARVSVAFDLASAHVDVAPGHALHGTVEVDATFEHRTGSPDPVFTSWEQPVRFS